MNRRHGETKDRLIIFSRYPIPGQTKTRLIPELGRAGAADLQRKLTETTFRTAQELDLGESVGVEVCFDGGNEQKMRQWLGSGAMFSTQSRGNLGNRMLTAFERAFQQRATRVVLIGCDIPELTHDLLAQAFEALNAHDLVLGPSTDGGYWLVGMTAPMDIFDGVTWGTNLVLDQTLRTAKRKGLKSFLLDPLSDIDIPEDLINWNPLEADPKPYISVIIPALNEGRNIQKAILSARNEDAEVIVVDGGSYDNTLEKAIEAGARVQTSAPCRAIQQNFGASFAIGKTLLFLHADTILPEDYVDRVFEAFMDPKTVAGAFGFKTDWDRPIMKAAEFLANFRSKALKLPYGDQGLFVRKAVFEACEGFPSVSIAEDLFFIRKISRKGRVRIVPAKAVTSARRWQKLGVLRTTLINQLIVVGCYARISPRLLANLYRGPDKK
jgi:rSAM/selenodomain-associated transferase 2/rSAM/selenodomain-associated transferase 1